MKTFDYVEEYLEVIAGQLDPVTGKPLSVWVYTFSPIINLARYDVQVLESMAMTTTQHQALTERQGDLLVKIILKYQRQLAAKGIDVSPVEKPVWRISLRKMDYSRRLSIANDKLIVRFPFDNKLIEDIKVFSKNSQGQAKWTREVKIWEVALTEYNLSWLHTWAGQNQFEIDPAVNMLMNQIKEIEKTNYNIELYVDNQVLNIRNAEPSLVTYVNEQCGGLGLDNLLRLVDMSATLGYTIEPALAEALVAEYGPRFYNLASNREIKINPNTLLSTDDFESVIDYANQTKRWPVVVYEPDLSGKMLNKLLALDLASVWINQQNRSPKEISPEFKYIHTIVPIRNMEHIPLIISSAGMVFGGDKQLMLQRAEKVVYCAVDVYNKKANSKAKDIAG